MNKSSHSLNIEPIAQNYSGEQMSEPFLFTSDNSATVVMANDQYDTPTLIAPKKLKPKQSVSGLVIFILLMLNIVAVVVFYFRNELFVSSTFSTDDHVELGTNKNQSALIDNDASASKDHSSIVSDVLTDLASVENARKSVAAKKIKTSKSQVDFTKQTPKKSSDAVRKPQRKPIAKKAAALPTTGVSGKDIRTVLDTFVKAYVAGNSAAILKLFKSQQKGSVDLAQLQANLSAVFGNSASRQISLEDMKWQYQGNNSIGQGKFKANVELTNNSGHQSIVADVKIEIRKTNPFYISVFQLNNVQTKVSTPNFPSLPLDPTSNHAMAPSQDELQNLLSQYINAFESGDIKWIASLFADNAVTNTHVGLDEVRQEYSELFKTSKNRRIFLKGLTWVYKKNHAKGTGKLDVFVTGDDGEINHIIKGKIKLIAKRQNNNIVISHLYHSGSK